MFNDEKSEKSEKSNEPRELDRAISTLGKTVRLEKITGQSQTGAPVKVGPFAAIVTGFESDDAGRVTAVLATVFLPNSQQFARITRPKEGEFSVGSWVESDK